MQALMGWERVGGGDDDLVPVSYCRAIITVQVST